VVTVFKNIHYLELTAIKKVRLDAHFGPGQWTLWTADDSSD
jgi:hypothetical protein